MTRDKNFLLDRLLKYEKPTADSSDEDSSSDESSKRKLQQGLKASGSAGVVKRRKIVTMKQAQMSSQHDEKEAMIEKLQARESIGDEMMTSSYSTVPQELFSNEPSMDSTTYDEI